MIRLVRFVAVHFVHGICVFILFEFLLKIYGHDIGNLLKLDNEMKVTVGEDCRIMEEKIWTD